MNGLITGSQIVKDKLNFLMKTIFSVLFCAIVLFPDYSKAQSIDSSQLAQILAKNDSTRKHLTYTGIIALQSKSEGNRIMKFRIWRNKNDFFHLEPVSPPEVRLDDRNEPNRGRFGRSERSGPGRRERRDSEISLMPNKKYLELLSRNYRIDLFPDEPIANRITNRLTIKPLYLPRFGMKIWFDRETSHILKREIVYFQPEGETLIFRLEYENIRYDEMPPDSLLKVERNSKRRGGRSSRRSSRPESITYSNLNSLKADIKKPIYVPSFIPKGFELSSIKYTKEKNRSIVHLQYTDGLLDFALFQSIGKPPRIIEGMINESNTGSNQNLEFRQFYACQKNDYSFLLIGNFSHSQLKKISESLKKN